MGHPSPGHLCPAGPRDLGCCLFPACPSPVPPVTLVSCPSVSVVLVVSATSTFHVCLRWPQALVLPLFLLLTLGHTPSPPVCEFGGAGVILRTDSMGRRPSCQAIPAGHTPMPARPVPQPRVLQRPCSLKGGSPWGPCPPT
ncbi:LOW QUALITY PROTEIN: ESPNL isoform 4 [Pongo abelii]|uniref:ESPNL isoform 4 n=1 Tax=Pongo abelii TaxID=9601 RepID=A0A2J8TPH1_PONAB|nr:LOW QUALITY PROTEIN: ESPNL isoform 4 [Pongo abelii]